MPSKYDCLIIDVVNLCYKLFKKGEDTVIQAGSKLIFKKSICAFIKTLEELVDKYLHSDGKVYLLFDNYFSRADLKTSFMFADRRELSRAYKETRKKENKEFYNSINFLKYFYLTGPSKYSTLQITGLEADDLVKPLLATNQCKDKSCLLITSDLDWCRYLNSNPQVDWLPKLGEQPETYEDISHQLGFSATESNIIIYKAILGDKSDNIEGLVTDNDKHRQELISLLSQIRSPEDLIYLSRQPGSNSSILKAIANNEKQYSVNIQLVSSIPCKSEYIESNLVVGEDSKTLHKTVLEALGLEGETPKFVFGNVKRPRI